MILNSRFGRVIRCDSSARFEFFPLCLDLGLSKVVADLNDHWRVSRGVQWASSSMKATRMAPSMAAWVQTEKAM